MRDMTVWPRSLEHGTVLPVGTGAAYIVCEVATLLDDLQVYLNRSTSKNPYSEGTAAQQIRSSVEHYFVLT